MKWSEKEELVLEVAIWNMKKMSREQKANTFQQGNLKMSYEEVFNTLVAIRYEK